MRVLFIVMTRSYSIIHLEESCAHGRACASKDKGIGSWHSPGVSLAKGAANGSKLTKMVQRYANLSREYTPI